MIRAGRAVRDVTLTCVKIVFIRFMTKLMS